MPKAYQRKTVDLWRISLRVPASYGYARNKWIDLMDVETEQQAREWAKFFFGQRMRFRIKRYLFGGNKPHGGGRPPKSAMSKYQGVGGDGI